MATPSSKYDVINTVTIGSGTNAVQRDVTDTYKNIYPTANEAFDKSIWYTKTKCKEVIHAGVPTIGGNTHVEYLSEAGTDPSFEWWSTATGTAKTRVYDLKFSPYQETDAEVGYTLGYYTSGAIGNYWWGANAAQENVIGSITPAVIRNWKYNENVLSVANITVYEKSVFEAFIRDYDATNPPSAMPPTKGITLAELIANPDKYFVITFRMGGTYLWNKTLNKYVVASQQFPVFNIDLKANGIGATGIHASYEQLFKSQILLHSGWSPYQVLCSAVSTSTYKPNGNRPFSSNIPLGLITDTNFYHYSLGLKSADYEVKINRQAISDVLDSIVIPTGQSQAIISERYVSFEKLTDDANHVVYSAGLMSGGKNQSRTWLTSYNWTPIILYKSEFIIKLIASFGLYVTADNEMATATPDTLSNTPNVYLGEMDSDGLTTGRLIPWTDLDKYEGYNKGGTDINPGFNPEGGGTDDDYPDDPWGKIEWGGTYTGAGNFTNLWYCTATDLNNLRRWINGLDVQYPLPEGFDPMNQILGLMQFPIGLGGSLTEELTMRTQSNATVHSGVMLNKGFGDDLEYNLGSINIPLRMKERGIPFLDYGSTVELYVPFCGVFQLDPQTVLGADVSVQMWLSPVTGECNCIVSVGRGENRGPVAFGSGNMASDIPVTANGYGLYSAAAKEASFKRSDLIINGFTQGGNVFSSASNTANTLAVGEQIAGQSIAGAWGAAGVAVGGLGAVVGLGTSLAKTTHDIHALDVGTQHMKNACGTTVSGSFSGTSAWHYPFQCYVKITRPRYKIPSNYAHTQGVPLVKAKPLSGCSGFTMCVGTDLSSLSATEMEKEQIAAFLSNGVIV